MFGAYVGVAIVSSLLLALVSGLGKLRRTPYIVKTVHDVVGVPIRWFPFLAGLEFAAAAGLLLGIRWAPLGVAAATGMVLYFVGAIVAHAFAALITRTLSL